MTLALSSRRARFTGAGTVGPHSCTFPIDTSADIKVYKETIATGARTLLTLTTDYTVDEITSSGFEVTTVATVSSSYRLIVLGRKSNTMETGLRNLGPYRPDYVEDELTKRTKVTQELKDEIDSSIKLPPQYSTSDFDTNLPDDIMVEGAGKAICINDDGDGLMDLADCPTVAGINAAASDAAAAAASAAAAATAETNAETAEANAETAETNAETAATNAATSASQAAASALAAAAASGWNVSGTFAVPNDIAGAGAIAFTAGTQRIKSYVQGSAGAQTVGSFQTGTIDGQELMLVGCSDTNTLTIDSPTRCITKGTLILAANDIAVFNWDNGSAKWVEVSRNN